MLAVDALWTLYRQQPRRVREAFRVRISQDASAEPTPLTEAEAKAQTIQRGRDIKAGKAKLIAHDDVMQEMEQMLATYAD